MSDGDRHQENTAPFSHDLPSIADTIRTHGLAADKSLGQHFLLDPAILRRIAEAAAPLASWPVLEIGPGPGGLTRALLDHGVDQVVAVERDRRCLKALAPLRQLAGGQLRLIEADALTIDYGELLGGRAHKIVANLPYNIGTALLVGWLERPLPVTSLHLLLQKEVVLRLTARPGSKAYGRLAILAQLLCEVRRCFDLPGGAFQPAPKVTSSLIALHPRAERPPEPVLKALSQVTHAAFHRRRKMLKSGLTGLAAPALDLLDGAGIDSSRRPEELSPEDFLRLATCLASITHAR